jgi:fatty acid desaturase
MEATTILPAPRAALPAVDVDACRAELSRGIEDQVDALRRHDGAKRALELALFPGLFTLGALLSAWSSAVLDGPTATALSILGTAAAVVGLNAMVLLLHEGLHGVLLVGPAGNRALSVLLGAPLLMSYSAYRVLHLRHHRYLGDPRDPDDYHNYTRSPALIWALHYTRIFLGSFLYLLLIPFLALRHGAARERRAVLGEYTLLIVLWVCIGLSVPWPLLLHGWLLPALITGLLVNLRGFCQHGLAEAGDPFLASRSILPNPLVAFILLNENLHLEHHLFPDVPSHNLPALRRLIVERYPRQTTGRSYLEVLARFFVQSLALDESSVGRVDAPTERGGGA